MSHRISTFSPLRMLLVALAALVTVPCGDVRAHEIPIGVTVHAMVHRDGSTVRMIVRAPLIAMRDLDFPVAGAGYLRMRQAESLLPHAAQLWIADAVDLMADGAFVSGARIVATRLSLPGDGAFANYTTANAHMASPPLADNVELLPGQAMLDVAIEYPSVSESSSLSVQSRWSKLGVHTVTVLHFDAPNGDERVLTLDSRRASTPVELAPDNFDTMRFFVPEGFRHILGGIDHLLFLLCLVIPVRRILPLAGVVTAFTVAHTITLVAAATGFAPSAAWFPPLVEVLIALSIVVLACENIIGARVEYRWMLAFVFGLVHGFGFSYSLSDSLQFAGGHLAAALGSFNLGVELGQLLVVLVIATLLRFFYRAVSNVRAAVIVLSALVAHQSWHWMTDRLATLRSYPFALPEFDKLFAAGLMRFAIVGIVSGVAMWLLGGAMIRLRVNRAARTTLGIALLVLAGVAVPATRANAQASRTTMGGVFTAKQAMQGREVFNGNCTGCHTTASHTGEAFTKRWIGLPLSDLFQYISDNMPKSNPGTLSEDEYVWVTAYLLRLNGMPAGNDAMSGNPELLKQIRIDTVGIKAPGLLRELSLPASRTTSRDPSHGAFGR